MTITYWNDRTAATTMVELLLLGIYTRIGNRGSKTQNQVISDDGVKVATVRSMGEEEEEREKKKKNYIMQLVPWALRSSTFSFFLGLAVFAQPQRRRLI